MSHLEQWDSVSGLTGLNCLRASQEWKKTVSSKVLATKEQGIMGKTSSSDNIQTAHDNCSTSIFRSSSANTFQGAIFVIHRNVHARVGGAVRLCGVTSGIFV